MYSTVHCSLTSLSQMKTARRLLEDVARLGCSASVTQTRGFKQVQQRHFRATSMAVDNEESKRAKLPFLANPEEVEKAGSSAEEQEAARNVAAARGSSSSSR